MSEEKTRKDAPYLPRSWGIGDDQRHIKQTQTESAPETEQPISPAEDDQAVAVEIPSQPQICEESDNSEALLNSEGTGSLEFEADDSMESEIPVEHSPEFQAPVSTHEEMVCESCGQVYEELTGFPEPVSGDSAVDEVDRPARSYRPEGDRERGTFARISVNVVGVRFGYACKIYRFDAGDLDLAADDCVIVKTEKGMGLGRVAAPPHEMELDSSQLEGLRKVIRKAGKVDFDQRDRLAQKEAEACAYCAERIEALGLPMKLVAVECYFDGSKYVFYFTADGRVDFRELVKQLVTRFPVRIEMRQIGVRHEAKMVGGVACCGQELCCSRFLTDFRPVSVKMAKVQNLSLNPTKISGVCGRLMCCLAYEHDTYEGFIHGLPKVGRTVCTTKGQGPVVKYNPLNETVSVKLEDETIVDVRKDQLLDEPDLFIKKKGKRSADEDSLRTYSDPEDESDTLETEEEPEFFP